MKGIDTNGSLTATVPETVILQLNMEVIGMDALFIQAVIVLVFMYTWIKDNENK